MNRPKPIRHWILPALAAAMLLSACSALQAPQVEDPHIYLLDARPAVKAVPSQRNLVVLVGTPRARPGFDTPQMAYLRQAHELNYFAAHRWADAPSRMLGPLMAQALEQTGSFQAVVQTPGTVAAQMKIDTELLRLQQDFGTQPSRVQLTLRAQLIDLNQKQVVAVKLFDQAESAISDDAYGGVMAANRLVERFLVELADFCVNESAHR
ncbi:MAG: ABC-type transport auxiliary lipoprotein family protein [Rhodoferax sp.]